VEEAPRPSRLPRFRLWLRGTRLVQKALSTPTDPVLLRPPSPRIVAGLVLLALSYVVGWPAIAALAAVAAWLRTPVLLLGGPVLYGLSWLVFAVGLLLLGSKSVRTGRALGRLLVRKLAEKYLRV
jgi:hypothetical protein